MNVLVTGSHGLIGSALIPKLRADGHRVLRLVRGEPEGADDVRWDPAAGTIDAAGLEGVDAVVHLAGAGIGDKKWTPARKQLIRDEPHEGDRPPGPDARRARAAPRRCCSRARPWATTAIGATPSSPSRPRRETTSPPEVCVAWEARDRPGRRRRDPGGDVPHRHRAGRPRRGAAADAAPVQAGPRRADRLRRPVHELDRPRRPRRAPSAISSATNRCAGPVNLTAPNPVTNAEFTPRPGRRAAPPDGAAHPAVPAQGDLRRRARAAPARRRAARRAAGARGEWLRVRAPARSTARCAPCSRRHGLTGLARRGTRSPRMPRRPAHREWGDRGVSNPRPPGPQPGALAN